ncbi:MAG: hypothetical protein HOP18_14745 [Deltaproteobacteria bacterium]|nr:hypothetical protein [Deltaproteobacteria bacterium]
MRVRKIGTWREEGPQGNHDSGMTVEALDAPRGTPRYAQVSYMFIADIRALARGETIDFPIEPRDLQSRV